MSSAQCGPVAALTAMVALISCATPALAGLTGDRLIVAEKVYEIAMRHNESFDRSNLGIASHGNSLLIPAESDPVIGLWDVKEYRAEFKGRFKTSCNFNAQKGYYLPGNNRFEYTGKTVDECKQMCCEVGWCKSFDYGHEGNKCWLSAFVEGASGIKWDESGLYDYYELDLGESVSQLLVVPQSSTAMSFDLVIGTADPSGNVYTWIWGNSNGKPILTPLGAYAPVASANANLNNAKHTKSVLAIILTGWQSSEPQVLTAGYDQTAILWDIDANGIKVQSRISGFEWPIWAATVRESQSKGIFLAGGHSEITRWSWGSEWSQSQMLKGHSELVKCMAYDSSLKILASAGADTRIVLWTQKADGNFEYGATLFDHTDIVTRLTFMNLDGKQLLFSGGDDGQVNIFNPIADETICSFDVQHNYYLPGNNRYVMADTSLEECKKLCCEYYWCLSFDYAKEPDPAGLHGPNVCWLSSWAEGASGVSWDSSGIYSYYEIGKRGTKMISIPEPKPIRSFMYFEDLKILAIAVKDESTQLMKITQTKCPDGYQPNVEGTKCVPCRLGYAGVRGSCDICPAGKYAPSEGSFKCDECPAGYASDNTETPSDNEEDLRQLDGLLKCTQCPPWALKRGTGRIYCEWCPPGEVSDINQESCIKIGSGARWEAPWGAFCNKDNCYPPKAWTGNNDIFCPRAGVYHGNCMYVKENLAAQWCPMTCTRPSMVLLNGGADWRCGIRDRKHQEQCNRLVCMGSLVTMQGKDWRGEPHKRLGCSPDVSDCTCVEDLREACKGGLLRLRNEQCKDQCTYQWCNEMCHEQRAREHMGVFEADMVENPFTVRSCTQRGTTCYAVCQNVQRRVTVGKRCGFATFERDTVFHNFKMKRDQLCGGDELPDLDGVCVSGKIYAWDKEWSLYDRPGTCVASRGIPQHGFLHAAAVFLVASVVLATH